MTSGVDDPFQPAIGELYLVRTAILLLPDPKTWRPAVVIERSSGASGRVFVVTRTTDTKKKGIEHPPAPTLRLTEQGVFWRYSSAEARMWTKRNCKLRGVLDTVTLHRVLKRFG